MRNIAFISFSDNGYKLATQIASHYDAEAVLARGGISHKDWTESNWNTCEALVYVGAAGIAVRSIAPHVRHKTIDPAVIVLDDAGQYVIPILSGHLGGANELAREIALYIGAVPVITTATDVNNRFSVDEWAKYNGMFVETPNRIVDVSSKIVAGKEIYIKSFFGIDGDIPEFVNYTDFLKCDVYVDIHKYMSQINKPLILVPKILTLGIGCRKGTTLEKIEETFEAFTSEYNFNKNAFKIAASIDVKKDEQGIIDFCNKFEIDFVTFSAEELNKVPGTFTASEFVKKTVGVDNVCERSAIKASEKSGHLIAKKFSHDGVTMAAFSEDYSPVWKWRK